MHKQATLLGVYTFHCMCGHPEGAYASFCLHRHNEVTQEVTSLVDELKSVPPKDRKQVHQTLGDFDKVPTQPHLLDLLTQKLISMFE